VNPLLKTALSLLALTLSTSLWSQINEADLPTGDQICPLSPSHQILSCKGTFTANNEAELDTYLQTVGFHNGFARNLRINFNVNRTDLSIATPCRVIMEPQTTITTTEETFCVNAHKGFRALGGNKILVNEAGAVISSRDDAIIFREDSEISAGAVLFTAKNQIVIHDRAKLRSDDVFILRSVGQTELSRVHIRHNAEVEAVNLLLIANHIATIGHTSQYQVQDLLELRSPQAEASSIWYDTKINAGELKINSGVVARVGARVEINAGSVHLDALECKVASNAAITSSQKLGNCFSGQHPTARVLTSDLRGQGSLNVNFDVSRSNDGPSGFDRAEWRFERTGSLVPVTSPQANYFYEYPGIYFADFYLFNQAGLRDSVRRRIDVDEVSGPGAPTVSYRYTIDQDDPELVHFELLAKPTPGSFIEMAKYIINNEEEIIADGTTYKSKTSYRFEERKVHKVKVLAVDNLGRSHSFERNLNLTLPEHRPVIDVDLIQVAPKKLFVDLHRSFGVHGGLSGGTIFWGDGARTELSSTFGVHTYQNTGNYELRVRLEDSSGLVSSRLFLVEVTDDNGVQLNPVANFEIEELSFAQSFRLYIDQSGTPNGEIVQALWNFGDGTTGQGMEVVHYYEPGVYNVSLTVTDIEGLTDTQTQQIIVHGGSPLVANLNCWSEGQTANCNWSALDSMKNLTEVKIDWGDGNTQEMALTNPEFMVYQNVAHTYAQGGNYNITITVANGTGQVATSNESIELFDSRPVAALNCSVQEDGLTQCDAVGSYSPQGITLTSYRFDFGDGTILEQGVGFAQHSYLTPGLYNVGLTITDLIGQQGATFQQVFVSGQSGSWPSSRFDCQYFPFSLSCSVENSTAGVNHEWFVNGVLNSNALTGVFNFTQAQIATITLKSTDANGRFTQSTKIFDVVENPDDLFVAELDCNRRSQKSAYCMLVFEKESTSPMQYSWSVNNINSDDEYSFANLTNLNVGANIVRVSATNGMMSKEYEVQLMIDVVPPLASFAHELTDDGLVKFTATNLSLVGTDLQDNQLFKWTVVGTETEVVTGFPEISFDFDAVNNKSMTLVLIDETEEESTTTQLISYSGYIPLAKGVIKYNQKRGTADRKVDFEVEDLQGELAEGVSYQWAIEGQTYNEREIQHIFSATGEFDIVLNIQNSAGKIFQATEVVQIEDHKFDSLLDYTYDALDVFMLYPENFVAEDEVKVFFNNIEVPLDETTENIFTTLIQFKDIAEVVDVKIHLDEYVLDYQILIRAVVYSQDPVQSYHSDIERLIVNAKNLTANDSSLSGLSEMYDELEISFKKAINILDSEDERKVLAYVMKKFSALIDSNIQTTQNFKVESKWNSLLNFAVSEANAYDYTENEINDRAASCSSSVTNSKLLKLSLNALVLSRNLSLGVSFLTLPAWFTTFVLTIVEISVVPPFAGYNESVLKSCIENTRFPFADATNPIIANYINPDSVRGSFPVIYPGLQQRVNFEVPVTSFFDSQNKGSIKGYPIYIKIKQITNIFNELSFNLDEAVDNANDARELDVPTTVADLFGEITTSILSDGLQEKLQDLSERIRTTTNGQGTGTNEKMLVKDDIQLRLDRPNLFAVISKISDNMYLSLRTNQNKDMLTTPTITWGSNSAEFARVKVPSTVVDNSFYVSQACPGEKLVRHKNIVPGGSLVDGPLVSAKAKISPLAQLQFESVRVCGEATILGAPIIVDDVHVDGSFISGNHYISSDVYLSPTTSVSGEKINISNKVRLGDNVIIESINNPDQILSYVNIGGNVVIGDNSKITFDGDLPRDNIIAGGVSISGPTRIFRANILNSSIFPQAGIGSINISSSSTQSITNSSIIGNIELSGSGDVVTDSIISMTRSVSSGYVVSPSRLTINEQATISKSSISGDSKADLKIGGNAKIEEASLWGSFELLKSDKIIKSNVSVNYLNSPISAERSIEILDSTLSALGSDEGGGRGLHLKNNSFLEVSESLGNNVTISEKSNVLVESLGDNATITDSSVAFSNLNNSNITVSSSSVSAANLGAGVKILNGSNVSGFADQSSNVLRVEIENGVEVNNSRVGGFANTNGTTRKTYLRSGSKVLANSVVHNATIGAGVVLFDSFINNVTISQNKSRNSCGPDNINLPPQTVNPETGETTLNPCYYPRE